MIEFIEFIVKHLVDNPSAVKVVEVLGETSAVYELRVSREDMGKVIGRSGRTAVALRTLVNAVSRRSGKHASLDIVD